MKVRMTRPSTPILILWALAATFLATGVAAGTGIAADGGQEGTAGPGVAVDTQDAVPSAPGASSEAPGAAGSLTGTPESPQESATRLGPGARSLDTPLADRLRSVLGLLVLGLIAWGLSVDRSRIPWRVVLWGLALQLLFALFILKTPIGEDVFLAVNRVIVALLGFTVEGARFLFGELVYNNVPVGAGEPGNAPVQPQPGLVANTGAYFAFNVLPTIIFFSSLMTVLYHLGLMQAVVRGVAWVMQRTMKTSGAETLSAAGNIFVGQTEAPLLIKPFVEKMTMSELMAVMTAGFATVAGGVLAAYVGMLQGYFSDIAGHLMAASIMSAPAALVVAKIMYPETGEPETAGALPIQIDKPDVNVIDAAARGASEGLNLALNVGAMLMAFLALVYLVNALLGWMGAWVGLEHLTMEWVLGWVLSPLAWLMGVEWGDARAVASLIGVKTVLNEFVAYFQLSAMLGDPGTALSPRSTVIATYALSGFANFSSIAIQLGGIGGIAPSRRHDLSRLGLRAMIAGSIAAFMTATVAGMLL
jgi:CNT family concentrative nucleoside transporter